MPEPVDKQLYSKIKAKVYKKNPKHSAYRSGIVVQEYKRAFYKKHGKKSPYKGKKTQKRGLARWFKEKWKDEKGNPCGSDKNKKTKKCRPTKKVSKKTPRTWGSLSKSQKAKAVAEKKRTGMGKRTSAIKKRKTKKKK